MSRERVSEVLREMSVQAGHLAEKLDDLQDYQASIEASRQEHRARVREYLATQGSDESRALIETIGGK